MAHVTEMPAGEAEQSPLPAGTPAVRTRKKGRRPGSPSYSVQNPKKIDSEPPFFKKVAAIPAEDWGTRAFMYVYIDEPVCVEKTWGQYSYALKCKQPILDLEPLKERYGSFKGWLSLNTRKSGKDATDQIDRHDFEIFDPGCPPKIPKGAWANDSRNDRWRALLPPEPTANNKEAMGVAEGMRLYKEIRAEVRDEIEPTEPQGNNTTREALENLKLAKEIMGTQAPATTPTQDPMTLGLAIAKEFLQMKSDNPMVDFLRDQMKTQAEELRDLRKAQPQPATIEKPKTMLEQLTELTSLKDTMDKLTGSGGTAARSGKFAWIDGVGEVLERAAPILTPIAQGFGNWITQRAFQQQTHQPANGGTILPPLPQQTNPAPDELSNLLKYAITPGMMAHFENGDTGEEFAAWLWDGYPDHFDQIQHFRHPMIPGKEGADAIIEAYTLSPLWPKLKPREAEFSTFVQQFTLWQRPPDEDPDPTSEPPANVNASGSTDFDAMEGEQ